MKIMIRSRLATTPEFHGEPWPTSDISFDHLPRFGDQFILPDAEGNPGRAFSVDLLEWRYDLGELHLLCSEYPKEDPPESPNAN